MTDALAGKTAWLEGRIAVAVVDPDDAVRSVLIEHLRGVDDDVATYPDLDTFAALADPANPVVVVVGPSEDPQALFPAVQDLTSRRPATGVILVVFALTPEILQRAIRSGVDDVVAVSAEDAELVNAISRVAGLVQGRVPAVAAPAPPSSAVAPSSAPEGQVVTVFSTKGGTGKSVIAVNLAIALAQSAPGPVVLLDADLQFGDVALMLQMQPSHTIAEAVAAGDRLDAALVESLLLRHDATGLYVLASPTEPGPADHISKADLARVIAVLRQMCAFIVIDTSANFGEITLAALQSSDQVLVLASLDVMSLKSAKVGLQTMRVLGISFGKIKFVLNRANTRVGLTVADAEKAAQLKADANLPSELSVAESVNIGSPVVVGAPRSKFAKGIRDLAAQVMSTAPAAHQQ
ncbi:MAG TPA: AAA family ATPase [Acidimicrobiales bacterium]|nr:AAA family ATPase [Acidimicrobiales bacterium]